MVNLRVECAATQDVISQQHMVTDALHALWIVTPRYESRDNALAEVSIHPSIYPSICPSTKDKFQLLYRPLSNNNSLSLQPKLMAKDLLDLVASHFNLKEKEYFGIAYTDET